MKTKSVLLLSLFTLCSFLFGAAAPAAHRTETAIAYHTTADATPDAYRDERCKLDLHYPENLPGFATIVWFHGGGLTGGKPGIPRGLQNKGFAVVSVAYRLSPKAENPAWLEDAAAATAWVFNNIAARGGDPKKVFIAGHSAGAWLAMMVGMDPRWLAPHKLTPNDLAGIIGCSGQVTTHFLVKKLRGDTKPEFRPIIDEYAPLYHASDKLPPICLILGDRKLEYKNRVEENDLLATALRNLGHKHVEFYELGGFNHGGSEQAAFLLFPGFIKRATAPAPAN